MYRNSVDAFKQLLSPSVSQISTKIGSMQNGITYCIVQVMFANGDEYRIEAYDEEANELCMVAKEYTVLLYPH